MASRKNWKDSTIFIADNLDIMRGMNSGQVDLIYLDPPFNSNHDYAAPIGSEAAGAAFKDTWTLQDVDLAWHGYIADKHPALYSIIDTSGQIHGTSMKSYLIYMAIRIIEMKRLLKPTGSIYLHCDPTAGHYLKLVMDAIFGWKNFRNEITWCYTGPGSPRMRQFNRKHDNLFWYSLGKTWTFNKDDIRLPYKDPQQRPRKAYDTGSAFEPEEIDKLRERGKIPETWWQIRVAVRSKRERTGYPTQKPLALLRRIIAASSNVGDVVFDPFCGCATACIAAQDLNRKWVACDISEIAGDLVVKRMENELGLFFDGKILTDAPKRSRNDLTHDENELFGDVKITRYNAPYNKYTLYGKQGGVCNGCGQKFQFKIFEVDHINPQAEKGSHHISNLQLLCPPCNSSKGDRSMKEFLDKKRAETVEALKVLDSLADKDEFQ